ncbi:hypothetical protein [Lentisalinibacter orientalis]|uniref:hypothetical protein n=1 Tax=Lentisalinibacter orientalis TaxID=2992241 RepID=UPI00386AC841
MNAKHAECPGRTAVVSTMLVLATLAVAGAAGTALAEEGRTTLTVGAEYTTGDYGGGSDIDDIYVPVTLSWTGEQFSLRATVPYAYVSAPEGSIIGRRGDVIVGSGDDVSDSGIGDVLLSGTWLGLAESDNAVLDVTAKVKLGTADEDKGLGTGETDYSLQLDGYVFQRDVMWMGTVGYKWRGDPAGLDLDDTWFVAGGVALWAGRDNRIGTLVSYRPELIDGGDAATEVSVFFDTEVSPRLGAQVYALAGLSDGSPDWGVGGSVSWSF